MPPTNEVFVFAPPRRLLVLRVTHNSQCAKLPRRQVLDCSRLSTHQHDLALYVFSRVIALLRSFAHVDQLRRHIRAFTVFREHDGLGFITSEQAFFPDHRVCAPMSFPVRTDASFSFDFGSDLAQLREFRVPRRPRPLCPIENLSVRRKLQNRHVAQSIRAQPLHNQFSRRMKPPRPALPVKPRNAFEAPFRGLPAQFIRQRRNIFLWQQWRLLRPRAHGHSHAPQRYNQAPSSHATLPPLSFEGAPVAQTSVGANLKRTRPNPLGSRHPQKASCSARLPTSIARNLQTRSCVVLLRPMPMPDAELAIQLDQVSRHYVMGESVIRAVNDVSLTVPRGEFLALLGSSGSGKSTLLNLIAGLDRPSSGSVVAQGQDLSKMSSLELARYRRETVGMVFQSFNLLPRMTLEENVELPLRLAEVDRSERAARVREALQRVGLEKRIGHRPSELSGGEQQRTAIARALVNRPKILLADEPTGNLDSATGESILTLLREVQRNPGMTIVMVTHERTLAERFADRLAVMGDGKLLSNGAAR